MRIPALFAVPLALLLGSLALPAQQPNWTIGPFTRPTTGNPILGPKPESIFTDPITGQSIHWEALHAFNPAAVVRNGHIFVLYRAEDDTGTMNIGDHTSRLGLAEFADVLTWTRLPAPVFYPDKDDQQTRESPGGTEDPRLVEGDDGTYVLTYTQWNISRFRSASLPRATCCTGRSKAPPSG